MGWGAYKHFVRGVFRDFGKFAAFDETAVGVLGLVHRHALRAHPLVQLGLVEMPLLCDVIQYLPAHFVALPPVRVGPLFGGHGRSVAFGAFQLVLPRFMAERAVDAVGERVRVEIQGSRLECARGQSPPVDFGEMGTRGSRCTYTDLLTFLHEGFWFPTRDFGSWQLVVSG